MTIFIPQAVYDAFPIGTFEDRVTAFKVALHDFARTVGQPAPTEDPVIAAVAKDGHFSVVPADIPGGETTLLQRQAISAAKVDDYALAILTTGAPWTSLDGTVTGRVQTDPDSQTKITAMATYGSFVKDGVGTWGAPYNQWILADNRIVDLSTWQEGLHLALTAGAYTGAVVFHARFVKDEVMASDTPENVDITVGWPT